MIDTAEGHSSQSRPKVQPSPAAVRRAIRRAENKTDAIIDRIAQQSGFIDGDRIADLFEEIKRGELAKLEAV